MHVQIILKKTTLHGIIIIYYTILLWHIKKVTQKNKLNQNKKKSV